MKGKGQEANPSKSEIRSPKSERSPKAELRKSCLFGETNRTASAGLFSSALDLVPLFGFRISDFGLTPPPVPTPKSAAEEQRATGVNAGSVPQFIGQSGIVLRINSQISADQ